MNDTSGRCLGRRRRGWM